MVLKFLLLILIHVIATFAFKNGNLKFVIDQTAAMRDDISCVIVGSKSRVSFIIRRGTSEVKDMVLVTFEDPDWKFRVHSNNRSEIEHALNNDVNIAAEGQCPEVSVTALEKDLRQTYTGSHVFLFTDDSQIDDTDKRITDIRNLCQGNKITVFFVLPINPRCTSNKDKDFSSYQNIATFSFGQVFGLKQKSDISQITDYITELVNGEKDVITNVGARGNRWTNVPFEIDEQTQYATVSTSGENVDIRILDQNNISISNFEKVVWIDNVKVVKIKKPGKYVAHVYSDSDASVEIFGRTDFTFVPAFSVKRVESFAATEKHVYKGLQTYLWISVHEPKHVVDIKSAKLFDMKEKLLQELPLEKVGTDVFRTDVFLPPDFLFKIAVKGVDNTGAEIVRFADLPVEPTLPTEEPITESSPEPNQKSSEYCFLMSVLTEMEKMSPTQKLIFKTEIEKALLNNLNETCEPKDEKY